MNDGAKTNNEERVPAGGILSRLTDSAAKQGVPLDVQWELTYRCNLRCGHCYVGAPHAAGNELSLSAIKSIMDHYIGTPSTTVIVDGKKMTPKEYLEKIVRLNPDDYEIGRAHV